MFWREHLTMAVTSQHWFDQPTTLAIALAPRNTQRVDTAVLPGNFKCKSARTKNLPALNYSVTLKRAHEKTQ
jgi:hypothetical protein